MVDVLANAVPVGAVSSDDLGVVDHSREIELLTYEDKTLRFQHRCDRGDRGVVICAPVLSKKHKVATDDEGRITVTPSIECPDCGTHGHITDGVWQDA